MTQPFPGGVSDEAQRCAFVRIATGELVAVELEQGGIRWRLQQGGRPLAASDKHLLVVDDQNTPLRFELLDAGTGAHVATIHGRDVPGLGDEASAADPVEAEIEETPSGPRVRWRTEQHYHGGASPPAGSAAHTSRTGEFQVEGVQATGAAGLALGGTATEPAFPGEDRAKEPPVDRFRLEPRGKPGSGKIVLEKLDPASGVAWSTELGPLPELRPGPLRR